MQTLAFVLALVALALFIAEGARYLRTVDGRSGVASLLAFGLAALTAAWIVQSVWASASTIVIH